MFATRPILATLIALISLGASDAFARAFVRDGVSLCPHTRELLPWSRPPGPQGSGPLLWFEFTSKAIKKDIPQYAMLMNGADISGELAVLNESEIDGLRSINNTRDAWSASGLYKERHVEIDEKSRLFMIRPKADFALPWLLFNQFPDLQTPAPKSQLDYLVASCSWIGAGPHARCTRLLIFDHFSVTYDFKWENIHLLKQIDAFIQTRIFAWKKRCETAS